MNAKIKILHINCSSDLFVSIMLRELSYSACANPLAEIYTILLSDINILNNYLISVWKEVNCFQEYKKEQTMPSQKEVGALTCWPFIAIYYK